jgi:hypothetical protein
MLCDIDDIFKNLQKDIANLQKEIANSPANSPVNSPKEKTKKIIKNAKEKVIALINDNNYNTFSDLLQQMTPIHIKVDNEGNVGADGQ